jgi:phage shock protein A
MGILSRAVRLCKADLHGVMDQMEDKDLLLRQHLREMQAALAERQSRIDQLEETQRAGKRNRSRVAQQLQHLEEDLDRAVARGRDDIARMLIRKVFPMRKSLAQMDQRLEETAQHLDEEQGCLGAQRLAYEETRHRVAAARERARSAALMPDMDPVEAEGHSWAPSEEEIEWELLQRKEAAGSGRTT